MSEDYRFTLERLETSLNGHPVLHVNNRHYLFFSSTEVSPRLNDVVETFSKKLIEDFGITGVELKILGVNK